MQTMTFTRRYIFKLAAPLLAAALMAAPAHAKPGKSKSKMDMRPAYQQSYAPRMVPQNLNAVPLWAQTKISAGQAKSIARRQHKDAKFVDISRRGNVYVVRLIKKDGRVVDVFVDATTGRVR